MQKKYFVSKEDKKLYDIEKQKEKEQSLKIFDRLHDLRKKIPTTLYGNSDRLIKLLELIKEIKEVLDKFIYKRISTISPKDMEKLSNLHNQIVLLNKEIQRNNYEQFKVIEIYMNDFLEQISFINSSIDAMSKLNKTLDVSKLSIVTETKNTLKELQDKLNEITTKLSEKNQLLKDSNDELHNLNVSYKLLENTIKEEHEKIEANKKMGIPYDQETKMIEDTQKKFDELSEKILKKQEERDKYENEYNDIRKEQLSISIKIDELKSKKGGRKTRKKNRKKH
jgi:chromosome segregation ATPase